MGGRGAMSATAKGGMTASQEEAVEYYVSGDGMYINQILRNGDSLYDEDRALIRDLDGATDKNIGETTLYRSVDASVLFDGISEMEYHNLVANLVYGDNQRLVAQSANNAMNKLKSKVTDKGYMSTSTDYEVVKDWGSFTGSDKPIVLEIKTKKTTKGVDVSKIGDKFGDAQKEVLLKRNQGFNVKSVSAKDGNIYVKVEME